MFDDTRYLSDGEKARLQILNDEITMLNKQVERTLKLRDRLQCEMKDIKESTHERTTKP